MGGLLEQFVKVQQTWPSRNFTMLYGKLSRVDLFEIAYHAASDVPFRCISIKINPGEEHKGNVAILYNSSSKQFISILNTDLVLKLDLFEETPDKLEQDIAAIKATVEKNSSQFVERPQELRDQISKCILVERKVDEAINFSLAKELARRVYFAIGECRERAATISIFQNSNGADLVQLALHKWMDFALRLPQDNPFPEDKVMPLVKNFLQIKKWLKEMISNQIAGVSTLKSEVKIE